MKVKLATVRGKDKMRHCNEEKKRKTLTREGAYAGEEVIHPLEIGDLQANVHSELKADH